jgi:hypothetical protein
MNLYATMYVMIMIPCTTMITVTIELMNDYVKNKSMRCY